MPTQEHSKLSAYLIFFLAASFYLYEFILQVAPSVMADPMMKTFHVTAEGFGVISAFYFYAYAPMQLPAGLLFDRYGPRKLMTFALMLCAFGSFFFASTDSVLTASLGRFLIGIGFPLVSSAAFCNSCWYCAINELSRRDVWGDAFGSTCPACWLAPG